MYFLYHTTIYAYIICGGDLRLLVDDGLNEISGQGLPPIVVEEAVNWGEAGEPEDREGILVRLDRNLHEPKELTRDTRGAVNTVEGEGGEEGGGGGEHCNYHSIIFSEFCEITSQKDQII